MAKINRFKEYSLNEIVAKQLLPIKYCSLYKLVTGVRAPKTIKKGNPNGKGICNETTYKSIKAKHYNPPWTDIKGKIFVKGEELIKFKELNNL